MSRFQRFISLVSVLVVVGCDDQTNPPSNPIVPEAGLAGAAAIPAPIESVATPFGDVMLWPFTGTDVEGTESDPINLIFFGKSDVRSLRAALMFLDGDRTSFGLPPVAPFNCTWRDAVGGSQTAYTPSYGWSGSAVQLECGDYAPMRFHIRLFPAGDVTLANAHFEVIIPGTSNHQVLSWELAKQLAIVDLMRTGLLDSGLPMAPTVQLHPTPYREIPDFIYNGLPVELRAAISGPLGNVGAPVSIETNGQAMAFNLSNVAASEKGVVHREFTIEFNQVIPKPFCAPGAGSFLYVLGQVDVAQTVRVAPSGNLHSGFRARGTLELTPVDPSTQPPTPLGETYIARVRENQKSVVTDNHSLVSHLQFQTELPGKGPNRGRLMSVLKVGPGEGSHSTLEIRCDP